MWRIRCVLMLLLLVGWREHLTMQSHVRLGLTPLRLARAVPLSRATVASPVSSAWTTWSVSVAAYTMPGAMSGPRNAPSRELRPATLAIGQALVPRAGHSFCCSHQNSKPTMPAPEAYDAPRSALESMACERRRIQAQTLFRDRGGG